MIIRHKNLGAVCPLALVLLCAISANALSIKRESVTEQVLIITTDNPLQDETPAVRVAEEVEVTTAGAGVDVDSQRDEPVGTTVDTMIIADTTGESWEVDPTASSIVSKDVEIEIMDGSSAPVLPAKPAKSESEAVDDSKPVLPEIYAFRIESDVKYRYSRTYVTSRVANKDLKRSHEVTFGVVLPETAFISKFIMEIDGKSYEAYVKEKEEAKKDYQQAQSQGQSAGLVEKSTRNSNVFNVNVNVKPQSKVTFNLTYEELLTRRLGRYEQAININPDQVSSIKDYKILVNIEESRNLTFVRVPSLSNEIDAQDPSGNNPDAVIDRPAPNKATISWSPSSASQKALVKEGNAGKFVVQYDVDRESDAGQILVMQGYFVHFFAPENLAPLKKHVVFILDISGSMWGRKMEQLKESQKKILDDLTADDYFNIITFSSDVYLWSPNDSLDKKGNKFRQSFPTLTELTPPEVLAKKQPLPATPENIRKAKAFIDSLVATGGTNIHDAIIEALNLTAVIKEEQRKANNPTTESPIEIETTMLPSSTSAPTAASIVSSVNTDIPLSTSATSSSSTQTPTSSTTDIPEIEEDTSIVIIDIAKSEAIDMATDKPDESATTIAPAGTILPANVQSLIIFLTDGEPTVGITDPPEIQRLIQVANRNLSIPIFSLGFGEGADFPFLKKLSLQNNGFGRKIYEASDAALQLKGFYNEIASPLLSNVTFNYTSADYNVTDVTVTKFPTVFGGTEIAVAGKLVAQPKPERVDDEAETTLAPSNDAEATTYMSRQDAGEDDEEESPVRPERLSIACDFELTDRLYLDVAIGGNGRDGEVDLQGVEFYDRRKCGFGIDYPIEFRPPTVYPPRPTPPPTPEDQFLERLWAYLTISQLLEQDLAQGDANKDKEDNSVENAIDVTPSKPTNPDETSIFTLALPVQGSTTPTPSKRNYTKPETLKERALRLALKYGFVTPLTSLVVVKPNSSDVTDAVSADARPDTFDSQLARRFAFTSMILAQPAAPTGYQASITPMRMTAPGSPQSPQPKIGLHRRRNSAGRGGGGGPRWTPDSSARSRIGNRLGAPMVMRTSAPRPSGYRANIQHSPRTGSHQPYQHYQNRFIPRSHHSGYYNSPISNSIVAPEPRYGPPAAAPWNSAPQSLSSAIAAPFVMSIRNKIASHPLPMPIHANYALNRQPLPVPFLGGSSASYSRPAVAPLGFGGPPQAYPMFSVDYSQSSDDEDPILPSPPQSTSVRPTMLPSTTPTTTTTTSSPAPLTLSDITWLHQNTYSLRVNETDYTIARQNTTIESNAGYDCTIESNGGGERGQCSHLKDCVLSPFVSDMEVFITSYFCPIQSSSLGTSYVGTCCPSRRSRSFVFDEDP